MRFKLENNKGSRIENIYIMRFFSSEFSCCYVFLDKRYKFIQRKQENLLRELISKKKKSLDTTNTTRVNKNNKN